MRDFYIRISFILITCLFLCSCGSGHSQEVLTADTSSVTYNSSESTAAPSEPEESVLLEDDNTTASSEDVSSYPAPQGPFLEIGGRILNGTEAGAEFIENVRRTVETTLNEYALFFIYKGFDLEPCVDPVSDLYGYLFGSDAYNRIYNEYYNYEYIESWSYSLFEASDYMLYSQIPAETSDSEDSQPDEEYFTVNVRYKLDITFTRPDDMEDENQKLDALWTFRNTEDGWKLCDISNNDQTLPGSPEISSENENDSGVSIFSIRGKDYDGVMMVIDDPSRVFTGTVPYFAYDYGQTVPEMIDTYESYGYSLSGGINGGNFDDSGTGSSYTAMPKGIVISEGDVVFAEYLEDSDNEGETIYHLTGLNTDGQLILGNMTASEAIELGIRDGVFTTEKDGPFLIKDGQILYDQLTDPSVYGAGKNPRTAIGQRSDGSLIMLVINGRQPSSLGASFEDLAGIMLECGAVTASAMDGGTSSQMIWKGEILNQPFSAFGLRMCPTAWLIRS